MSTSNAARHRLPARDVLLCGFAAAATLASWLLLSAGAAAPLRFVVCTVGIAMLAAIVGRATEYVGARLGPGATGVLQSALGNLPELFIGVFSLRAGLVLVVQTAMVGSILANSLLVLGIAFMAGGLKNGKQQFRQEAPQLTITLTALAVGALVIPTLAHQMHTRAAQHTDALSVACALLLLAVFAASVPVFVKGGEGTLVSGDGIEPRPPVSLWAAGAMLLAAGLASAFMSDWFVAALEPAMRYFHLSDAFTGLVIVAIAGNAVENIIGVRLAMVNQMDYAVSVILNSSLQVALALVPLLVLLSFAVSPHHLTLVMPPLLVASLALTTGLNAIIVYDGESHWIEGLALIGLYAVLAASFWWG